jgi:hypothetical protein
VFHLKPDMVWRVTLPGNPTASQFHHIRNHNIPRQQQLNVLWRIDCDVSNMRQSFLCRYYLLSSRFGAENVAIFRCGGGLFRGLRRMLAGTTPATSP